MRVDLRRRDVAVAEHLLQRAQVGAAFEHVRGKAVAQQVRVQPLDADFAPVFLDYGEDGAPADAPAARVQKHRVRVLGRARLRVKMRPAGVQIGVKRAGSAAQERHEALLAALAAHAHQLAIAQKAGEIEADQLAYAQATAVEHLEHGLVAQAGGRLGKGLVEQGAHLPDGKGLRQRAVHLGQGHRGGRVCPREVFGHGKAVKALQGGHVALHTLLRIATRAQIGDVVDDGIARDVFIGAHAALREKPEVVAQIGRIRIDACARQAAFGRQVPEILVKVVGKGARVGVGRALYLARHGKSPGFTRLRACARIFTRICACGNTFTRKPPMRPCAPAPPSGRHDRRRRRAPARRRAGGCAWDAT